MQHRPHRPRNRDAARPAGWGPVARRTIGGRLADTHGLIATRHLRVAPHHGPRLPTAVATQPPGHSYVTRTPAASSCTRAATAASPPPTALTTCSRVASNPAPRAAVVTAASAQLHSTCPS